MSFADSNSLRNQLLIATPTLADGIFKSSVTYICEHNEDGAMGIIINRPSDLMIKDILEDINAIENSEFESRPVMLGGPVGLERGFVLHQTGPDQIEWLSSLQITDDVALTGSKDILASLLEGQGPENFLLVLGYAGWSAGQLEQELVENAWLTSPATTEILFSTPYHLRAAAAAKLLGVDLSALATQGGNA
jgi:putative transcriptional regulator